MDVRLAQLDRAFGYGPKGRGFESSSARCKYKKRDALASLFLYLRRTPRHEPEVRVYAPLRWLQAEVSMAKR